MFKRDRLWKKVNWSSLRWGLWALILMGSSHSYLYAQSDFVSDLPATELTSKSGYGHPTCRKDQHIEGSQMRIRGGTHPLNKGLGCHADGFVEIQLNRRYRSFSARVGIEIKW